MKAIKEVQDIAREHTALAMKTLAEIAGNSKMAASARVTAATVLLERGWGKPKQEIEVHRSPLEELEPDELFAVSEALAALAGSEGGSVH